MYEGQATIGQDYQHNMAKLQAAASQNQCGTQLKQRDQSAVEQSIDRLAKIMELATMNADSLFERLAPVTCQKPSASDGATCGSSAGCLIEARIEAVTERISLLSQRLADQREALRI